MKWILVWWIIHPGHAQVIHMERDFPSAAACERAASEVQAPPNKLVRIRCSIQ
jgi:hypothetical protein